LHLTSNKIDIGVIEDKEAIIALTVDGVHFRTAEQCRKQPSSAWYSHKHNGPGLTYELGIAIRQNKLVWINGPFRASTHDMAVFKKPDGLWSRIPQGKKALGDSGYKGVTESIAIRDDMDSREVKEFKRRALARHETFNGRIKTFSILDNKFRHSLEKHQTVMEAICVITQYDLENGNPLFDV
jgi:hypothetical protein